MKSKNINGLSVDTEEASFFSKFKKKRVPTAQSVQSQATGKSVTSTNTNYSVYSVPLTSPVPSDVSPNDSPFRDHHSDEESQAPRLSRKRWFQRRDKSSPPQLHQLVVAGNISKITSKLLKNRANVNETDSIGRTPLHYAAAKGACDIITILCDVGNKYPSDKKYKNMQVLSGETDLNIQDNEKKTPLMLAVSAHQNAAVMLLLVKGANPRLVDSNLRNVLHLAAQLPDADILKLLFDKGININDEDEQGQTALHHAVRAANFDGVKSLIEKKVSLDAQDKLKKTSLHYASELGFQAIVDMLLEKESNIHIQDIRKRTPLDYAMSPQILLSFRHYVLTKEKATETKKQRGPPSREASRRHYEIESNENMNPIALENLSHDTLAGQLGSQGEEIGNQPLNQKQNRPVKVYDILAPLLKLLEENDKNNNDVLNSWDVILSKIELDESMKSNSLRIFSSVRDKLLQLVKMTGDSENKPLEELFSSASALGESGTGKAWFDRLHLDLSNTIDFIESYLETQKKRMDSLRLEAQTAKEQLNLYKEEKKVTQAKIAALNEKMERATYDNTKLNEAVEKLRGKVDLSENEMEALKKDTENKIQNLLAEQQENEHILSEKTSQLMVLQIQLRDQEELIKNNSEKVKELFQKLEESQQQNKSLETKLDSQNLVVQQKVHLANELTNEKFELTQYLEDLKNECKSAKKLHKDLQSQYDELDRNYYSLKTQLEVESKENTLLNNTLNEKMKFLKELNDLITDTFIQVIGKGDFPADLALKEEERIIRDLRILIREAFGDDPVSKKLEENVQENQKLQTSLEELNKNSIYLNDQLNNEIKEKESLKNQLEEKLHFEQNLRDMLIEHSSQIKKYEKFLENENNITKEDLLQFLETLLKTEGINQDEVSTLKSKMEDNQKEIHLLNSENQLLHSNNAELKSNLDISVKELELKEKEKLLLIDEAKTKAQLIFDLKDVIFDSTYEASKTSPSSGIDEKQIIELVKLQTKTFITQIDESDSTIKRLRKELAEFEAKSKNHTLIPLQQEQEQSQSIHQSTNEDASNIIRSELEQMKSIHLNKEQQWQEQKKQMDLKVGDLTNKLKVAQSSQEGLKEILKSQVKQAEEKEEMLTLQLHMLEEKMKLLQETTKKYQNEISKNTISHNELASTKENNITLEKLKSIACQTTECIPDEATKLNSINLIPDIEALSKQIVQLKRENEILLSKISENTNLMPRQIQEKSIKTDMPSQPIQNSHEETHNYNAKEKLMLSLQQQVENAELENHRIKLDFEKCHLDKSHWHSMWEDAQKQVNSLRQKNAQESSEWESQKQTYINEVSNLKNTLKKLETDALCYQEQYKRIDRELQQLKEDRNELLETNMSYLTNIQLQEGLSVEKMEKMKQNHVVTFINVKKRLQECCSLLAEPKPFLPITVADVENESDEGMITLPNYIEDLESITKHVVQCLSGHEVEPRATTEQKYFFEAIKNLIQLYLSKCKEGAIAERKKQHSFIQHEKDNFKHVAHILRQKENDFAVVVNRLRDFYEYTKTYYPAAHKKESNLHLLQPKNTEIQAEIQAEAPTTLFLTIPTILHGITTKLTSANEYLDILHHLWKDILPGISHHKQEGEENSSPSKAIQNNINCGRWKEHEVVHTKLMQLATNSSFCDFIPIEMDCESAFNCISANIDGLKKNLIELKSSVELKQEKIDEQHNTLGKWQNALNKANSELLSNKSVIDLLQQQLKESQSKCSLEKQKVEHQSNMLSELEISKEKQFCSLNQRMQEEKMKFDELDQKLHRERKVAKVREHDLELKLIEAHETIREWDHRYHEKERLNANLQTKLDVVTSQLNQAGQKLEILQNMISERDIKEKNKWNQLEQLQARKEELSFNMKHIEAQLHAKEAIIAEIKKENSELVLQLGAFKQGHTLGKMIPKESQIEGDSMLVMLKELKREMSSIKSNRDYQDKDIQELYALKKKNDIEETKSTTKTPLNIMNQDIFWDRLKSVLNQQNNTSTKSTQELSNVKRIEQELLEEQQKYHTLLRSFRSLQIECSELTQQKNLNEQNQQSHVTQLEKQLRKSESKRYHLENALTTLRQQHRQEKSVLERKLDKSTRQCEKLLDKVGKILGQFTEERREMDLQVRQLLLSPMKKNTLRNERQLQQR